MMGQPVTDSIARLLDALPGFSGHAFNPGTLVAAVNALHARGFANAVDLCRVHSERAPDNVLMVARVLFVPQGRTVLPPLYLGGQNMIEPHLALFPLFPLRLQGDLPFLLVDRYARGGEAPPASDYIDWCAANCELHARLRHTDDPLVAADRLIADLVSHRVTFKPELKEMLRQQAERATSTADRRDGGLNREGRT